MPKLKMLKPSLTKLDMQTVRPPEWMRTRWGLQNGPGAGLGDVAGAGQG